MGGIMALTLNSNSLADFVSQSLNSTYKSIASSIEKLSTGLRINSFADDPAGAAVSSFMRSDIAGINQAIRNAEDGVSLLQTAEGGMNVIDEKLLRMKELAEQAATGTYTNSQRLIMQSEFTLMGAEIDRIAEETTYNSLHLLDGSLSSAATWQSSGGWTEPNGGMKIQVGLGNSRSEDYYYLTIDDVRTTNLFNSASISVSTQAAASTALSTINTAIINKDNALSWVGALQNRLEGTIDVLEAQSDSLTNAESGIVDVDYAKEMTNYISEMVVAQAATAMLAQANLLPQLILNLLKF